MPPQLKFASAGPVQWNLIPFFLILRSYGFPWSNDAFIDSWLQLALARLSRTRHSNQQGLGICDGNGMLIAEMAYMRFDVFLLFVATSQKQIRQITFPSFTGCPLLSIRNPKYSQTLLLMPGLLTSWMSSASVHALSAKLASQPLELRAI